MIVQKVTPADLAKRLGTSPQVVNRILDHKHMTKIDTIAEALEALGKHLELAIL
jgi:antitoxin HicB